MSSRCLLGSGVVGRGVGITLLQKLGPATAAVFISGGNKTGDKNLLEMHLVPKHHLGTWGGGEGGMLKCETGGAGASFPLNPKEEVL